MGFKIDQLVNSISFCKSVGELMFVLIYASNIVIPAKAGMTR